MLNKAILMGRLTRDPEVRTTTSGVSVARFSLAIDRRFQRQGEERQTDFINIVCFNRTADFVKQYFVKGQMMCVVGSIQTRSWEGQDGRKNYATEVIADEVNFCGSKKETAVSGANAASNNYAPAENSNDGFMPIDDDESLPF